MEDHEYGELRDYTRRRGVVTSFTVMPANAPAEFHQPERLWNAAEAAENRKNSTVAREVELALPAELTHAEREVLVRAYATDLVARYGVAITVAIHSPGRGSDLNFHAHILMTTRRVTENGLGEKTRELDAKATGPKEIVWMREHACGVINDALACAGIDERVDHRSFKDRGISRQPTKHLGPTAAAIERRGEESDRGSANRDAEERNHALDAMVEEYKALDAEIIAEEERVLYERFGGANSEESLTLEDALHRATDAATVSSASRGAEAEEEAQVEADVAPFVMQIRQAGEIPQQGLATSWWEHAAQLASRAFSATREFVAGLWSDVVGRER